MVIVPKAPFTGSVSDRVKQACRSRSCGDVPLRYNELLGVPKSRKRQSELFFSNTLTDSGPYDIEDA